MTDKAEPTVPFVHELKCWPEFFDAVARGDKTFEIRKNDRGFQRGDVLWLRKFDPQTGLYVTASGWNLATKSEAASLVVAVSYVLNGFGLEPGYVCMAIAKVNTGPT
jgi:hypothetical protein